MICNKCVIKFKGILDIENNEIKLDGIERWFYHEMKVLEDIASNAKGLFDNVFCAAKDLQRQLEEYEDTDGFINFYNHICDELKILYEYVSRFFTRNMSISIFKFESIESITIN